MRRTRTKSESSTAINESQNEIFEDTINSLPDLSNDNINDIQQQQIIKLKEQIDQLKIELNSARQEIESLSLENNDLKQINIDLRDKNDLNKKNTQSTISKLTKSIPITKKCVIKTSKPSQTDTSRKVVKTDATGKEHKLCIISSNNKNKIVPIAEDIFPNSQICHYLKPLCGIENLIDNLHTKLTNYAENDFCIIFIGEEDFRITKNYYNLTVNIRETLRAICHTNIILCLPTYKCSEYSSMFNWRVEMFNNMLYLDNLTHQYAYLLDSNLQLTYEMFSHYTGRLNNHGMLNIYDNLHILIKGLIKNTQDIAITNTTSSDNLQIDINNDRDRDLSNNMTFRTQ